MGPKAKGKKKEKSKANDKKVEESGNLLLIFSFQLFLFIYKLIRYYRVRSDGH